MTIFNVLLAIGVFALTLFLIIQYGGVHIQLSLAAILIVMVALFIGSIFFDTPDNYMSPLPWALFAWLLSYSISIPFQRRKAGNLLLTYKNSAWSMFWKFLNAVVSCYLAYMLLTPDGYIFQNDPDGYFRMNLPLGILAILLAIISLTIMFRKGEFRENGIVTPDLGYFLWSGYKSYEWVGYRKKDTKHFLLYLEGARNETISIDYLSEQDKNILEELLSKKLPQVNPST